MTRLTSDRGLVKLLLVVIVMNALIGIGAGRYYAGARNDYIVAVCKSQNVSTKQNNRLNKRLHHVFAMLAVRSRQAAKIDRPAKRPLDIQGVKMWSQLRDASSQIPLARC